MHILLLISMAATAWAGTPMTGGGALLPIQDRVDDPATARIVEKTLHTELTGVARLADTGDLRDILRRLRIRDVGDTPPASLEQLGRELGVEWFFSSILHEAIAEPIPQITVSARIYRVGTPALGWVGFESASGLDDRQWLGRGGTLSLAELAQTVSWRLLGTLVEGAATSAEKPRFGPSTSGFLRGPIAAGQGTRVAVVPFDSVNDRNQSRVAETVTESALAVLYRHGVTVLFPGLVTEIQREQGTLLRGEADHKTLQALRDQAQTDLVFTGTVETFASQQSIAPNPWIAFSARLVDPENGRILWMDGQERTGWQSEGLFESGRVYSAGSLTNEMMSSLVTAFLGVTKGGQERFEE
jgi:TolB-like protein